MMGGMEVDERMAVPLGVEVHHPLGKIPALLRHRLHTIVEVVDTMIVPRQEVADLTVVAMTGLSQGLAQVVEEAVIGEMIKDVAEIPSLGAGGRVLVC